MYRIDIMTLFPSTVGNVLSESILGRAQKRDLLRINTHQIRDYTLNKQKQVDDYPYGGGRGAILQADPLYQCWRHIAGHADQRPHTIYLSPCGKTFTQNDAKRLSREFDHLVLVCGHYEGIDQRFIDECVDEEISLGDFVLTGGEIAAMAVADAVCRLIPGVLADPECFQDESHWDGLLEYPQYSRPELWHDRAVPEALLTGNHSGVLRWRRKQQLLRTMERRPDMFAAFHPTDKLDTELLREIEKDRTRMVLSEPISCRPGTESDLPAILEITAQARRYLWENKVDQWQDQYPNEAVFRTDLARGDCYVLTYGTRLAGFFVLSDRPEPCYDALTDGKWSSDAPYCVLHRCAVGAEFRGSGLSDRMAAFAEDLCRTRGRTVLRADTHRKNKAMQAMLERNGFRFRGNVLVQIGEGHDPRRKAYEKIL